MEKVAKRARVQQESAAKISIPGSLEEKFKKKIRPLLDAVDTLRSLKVTDEGVTLPTIVVVGDQSSGKSSVLESLATISLPRGEGIVTRVPLILRLQNCRPNESSISITANDKTEVINEDEILASVEEAQNLLAGSGKGVSDTPITLHIKKPGAPDLTMIDLPGIPRVPVFGQPKDIYEKIASMIRLYIKPPETIILNVISGLVDFSTCESIKMAHQEDKEGQRTLAVVTKMDKSPDGICEKIMANDVNIGVGFVCVRNRIDGDSSHEVARERERELFTTHPTLSKLDKSTVGIGSVVDKLTQIQATIIRRNLPIIVKKIETAILEREKEWEIWTQSMDGEVSTATFFKIVDTSRTVMENIIKNGKYDSYLENRFMHYPPRLDEMFRVYNNMLHQHVDRILSAETTREILDRMSESKGLTLPNFLSSALMASLVEKEVDNMKMPSATLVSDTHEYAKRFAYEIINQVTKSFPKLQASYKEKLDKCIQKSHDECLAFVTRTLKKERANVFTNNQSYNTNLRKLKAKMQEVRASGVKQLGNISMEDFEAAIDLHELESQQDDTYFTAFEIKVSLAVYWTICFKRMADNIFMEIKFSLEQSLLTESRHKLLK